MVFIIYCSLDGGLVDNGIVTNEPSVETEEVWLILVRIGLL